jgi:hypothetical protein
VADRPENENAENYLHDTDDQKNNRVLEEKSFFEPVWIREKVFSYRCDKKSVLFEDTETAKCGDQDKEGSQDE